MNTSKKNISARRQYECKANIFHTGRDGGRKRYMCLRTRPSWSWNPDDSRGGLILLCVGRRLRVRVQPSNAISFRGLFLDGVGCLVGFYMLVPRGVVGRPVAVGS